MKTLKTIAVVAVAAVTVAARAQEFDPELMAKMAPGEMHALLAKYAGDWTVSVKFRMVEGAAMQDGEAECRAVMVMNGMFLKKRYESEMMGQPFFVEEMMGYDGLRGHFFEFTVESMSTSYMMVTGRISADKKEIRLYGQQPDPMQGGKMVMMKVVYKLVSDDEYVVEWWEPTKDGKEEMAVQLTHRRKKEE